MTFSNFNILRNNGGSIAEFILDNGLVDDDGFPFLQWIFLVAGSYSLSGWAKRREERVSED